MQPTHLVGGRKWKRIQIKQCAQDNREPMAVRRSKPSSSGSKYAISLSVWGSEATNTVSFRVLDMKTRTWWLLKQPSLDSAGLDQSLLGLLFNWSCIAQPPYAGLFAVRNAWYSPQFFSNNIEHWQVCERDVLLELMAVFLDAVIVGFWHIHGIPAVLSQRGGRQ